MPNNASLSRLSLYVVILAALAGLWSCQSTPTAALDKQWAAASVEVIKSPGDQRDYATFQLANGMRVLVISDPDAEKAAVSLDVLAGSKDDPPGREGLAHFLEHMLFLGTGKYPDAGEYQAFIASHGGQHNAYTAFENTNYFFDINAAQLAPALDRFSQFFIDPLFTAAYVEREKHAVESEYRTRFKDDGRRGLDVFTEVINPDHPFADYAVGSLDSLADREGSPVRDELLAFYAGHYSADVMHLAVLGAQPVDVLRALVERAFAAVPDRQLEVAPIGTPLFTEGSLPAQVFITPEKNMRRLELTFPVADSLEHWRAKPVALLGDIIGHEGEGSLLQYLKAKGWAQGLSAGEGLAYRGGATFNITVALTEQGFAQRDQVVTAIFQAIDRIADEGISEQRFEEQRQIAELRFRYQEKAENVDYVVALAGAMALYPPAMLLKAPFEFSDYQPRLYRDYLAQLRPDNMLLTVIGPGLTTDRESALYQTPYALAPLGNQQLDRWRHAGLDAGIRLPGPNAFIPAQLARVSNAYSDARPVRLANAGGVELWHGDDAAFALPRTSVRLALMSPIANDSARHRALLELFGRMVKDGLNPKFYPAALVGFDAELRANRRGLMLAIDGFSDKQEQLLEMIGAEIAAAPWNAARFGDIKRAALRDWENARRKAPYSFLYDEVKHLLYRPDWSDAELLAAAASVRLSDLMGYRREFLSALRARLLVYGSSSPEQARGLLDALAPVLRGAGEDVAVPEAGLVELGSQERWRHAVSLPHSDAAIAYYVQGDGDSNEQRVRMGLTGQIIATPYYQSLRTDQQFGYVVYAAPTVFERMPGLTFIVQSPVADAGTLYEATNHMLASFNQEAQSMSAETFAQHKVALASQINRPHQNLAKASSFLWDELMQGYERFDRRQQLTAALDALTLDEWRAFYAARFASTPGRSLLVFQPGAREPRHDVLAPLRSVVDRTDFQALHRLRHYP